MNVFSNEYDKLNVQQKDAVDAIEGPLLVIAGPGTGKTQLLSARVANILNKTDTLPHNILCLTFTESGAANMRQRLARFIGKSAYDVMISTYHAFGSDIIQRYPQYFTNTNAQEPIDELTKQELLRHHVETLPYKHPLKHTQHHIGDLLSTISELKRALITPKELKAIARDNIRDITTINKALRDITIPARLPGTYKAALPLYTQILDALHDVESTWAHRYSSLLELTKHELKEALLHAENVEKSTPLTAWKNKWLEKDTHDKYVFSGHSANEQCLALADTLYAYESMLIERGLYDFDDMIIRSISAIEENTDLKFTLQEQYLYILLDEFQDTNAAQLRLVQLLADNPVHEGRPNVMAVGDDNQAIFSFQGAQYSNMIDFYKSFHDVKLTELTENYRSHADILHVAANVGTQIKESLDLGTENGKAQLRAANEKIKNATVQRTELESDIAQYDWVSTSIESLTASGVDAQEIAVLAPKHALLETMVTHLNAKNIAVNYERRENILDAPLIRELLSICRLLVALKDHNIETSNELWPEVLSYDFWQIPISTLWKLSWTVHDSKSETNWTHVALDDTSTRKYALLLVKLSLQLETDSAEMIIDHILGTEPVSVHEDDYNEISSPFREFYTSAAVIAARPDEFYTTLSHLRVLRNHVRKRQAVSSETLMVTDVVGLVDAYNQAGMKMLNTSPHTQSTRAVQLLTAFKAKGLEFEHVFLLSCHDDVWGRASRSNTNKLSMSENLKPIRHPGATDDERLRLLYVAITRAKVGLYMTSYSTHTDGKPSKPLSYLNEQVHENTILSPLLPETNQLVMKEAASNITREAVSYDWRMKHIHSITSLRDLAVPRLETYQLSPTHLNSFTDTIHGGPEVFLFNTLLRFPKAPGVHGQYGNAIHETLEWTQRSFNEHGSLPNKDAVLTIFDKRIASKKLPIQAAGQQIERGHDALTTYLDYAKKTWNLGNVPEHNFFREGVFVGDAHMSGKIDRLDINKSDKTITIVDYKTGKGFDKWRKDAKLHKFKTQLYCYKILVENSHSYKGYKVIAGSLEFVEPNDNGTIDTLTLKFDDTEEARIKLLIKAVWKKVIALDMPDIRKYPNTLNGIIAFEEELINQE